MTLYIFLLFAGLLGGFLAGLIGIGGGVIYIFVLEIIFIELGILPQEIPQFTIANSIFAVFFASLSANISLIRLKQFYWKTILLVGVGSIITSLFLLAFVVNTSWFSKDKFNWIVILILLYMLLKLLFQQRKETIEKELKEVKPSSFILSGIAGGMISSISGLGGGVVMMPIFTSFLKLNIKKAKAISLGVICLTAFMMTLFNFTQIPISKIPVFSKGIIIFPISLLLALGVIISAPLGVKFAQKWSSKRISIIYIIFLSLFLLKKIITL